jgi:hypothetical protein
VIDGWSWGMPILHFHSSANGRKRKTKFQLLEDENGHSISQFEIVEHIVQFYKALFGSSLHTGAHLSVGFWDGEKSWEKRTEADYLFLFLIKMLNQLWQE